MRFAIPPRLAWEEWLPEGEGEPVLYLMKLPDGIPLVLTGSAALIWLAAIDRDAEEVAVNLVNLTGQELATVARDAKVFLQVLVNQRLLATRQ